jgi:hypothetical protein
VFAAAKRFCRVFLERLSFLLWIGFTVFSVVLIGLGVMSILYSGIIMIGSGAQPPQLPLVDSRLTPLSPSEPSLFIPLVMIAAGIVATLFSLLWRQTGIDHFHYADFDTLVSKDVEETLASTLSNLIQEVEGSAGDERREARAKAKAWLVSHVSDMDEEEILLARNHFGYLLPAQWGR